ncbi:MAG: hypothetical protein ACRC1H_17845 [Caldilineaceae bacterium]
MKIRHTLLPVFLAILAAALLAATPAQAQEPEPSITILSAAALSDVTGARDVWTPALSADGAFLAYFNKSGGNRGRDPQICLFAFADESETCSLVPDGFINSPYQLQWSPDGSAIAFTENPIDFSMESDLWLLDTTSGDITNLTDDGLTGSWRSLQEDNTVELDYLPMWNATDGLLYFFRAVPMGRDGNDVRIFSLASADDEPTEVQNLTNALDNSMPAFASAGLALEGAAAISPDGATLATLSYQRDSMGGFVASLWVSDLTDPGAAPVLILDPSDLFALLPPGAYLEPVASGLAWTADGTGLTVLSTSLSATSLPPVTLLTWVDAATGAIEPVIDFSSVVDENAYFAVAPGGAYPWSTYSPLSAVVMANTNTALMVGDMGRTVGLFAAPLPPTGELPPLVASAQNQTSCDNLLTSRATDGKIVVCGYLLETE